MSIYDQKGQEKFRRLDAANELVRVISAHGRRFFFSQSKDRVGHFHFNNRLRLFWVDEYTGKAILLPNEYGKWGGFSHGGTLRAFIQALGDYVRKGHKIDHGYLKPRPRHVWGYLPADLEPIHAAGVTLGIFEPGLPEDPEESTKTSV